MVDSRTAILRLYSSDNSWTQPHDSLWKKLLNEYLFQLADTFGIRGVTTESNLFRSTIFNFIDMCPRLVRTTRYVPGSISLEQYSNSKDYREEIGLFELTEDAQRALAFPDFGRWTIQDETYLAAELNFFLGPIHLAMTDESDVVFYDLSPQWHELLCSIDPIISRNLWIPTTLHGDKRVPYSA